MTLANRVRALFFLTHLQGTPATKNEVLSFLLVFAPAAAAAADYMAGLVDETYAAVAFDVRERCRTRRERVCRLRRVWRHVMWPAPSAAPWSARPLAATLWTTCVVVVDGGMGGRWLLLDYFQCSETIEVQFIGSISGYDHG